MNMRVFQLAASKLGEQINLYPLDPLDSSKHTAARERPVCLRKLRHVQCVQQETQAVALALYDCLAPGES